MLTLIVTRLKGKTVRVPVPERERVRERAFFNVLNDLLLEDADLNRDKAEG